MTFSMQQKFDKYWGNLEKINVLLYIATILDPRCKMESIKHGFGFLYDDETSAKLLKQIEDVLYKLYNFYKEMITPPTPTSDPQQKKVVRVLPVHNLPCWMIQMITFPHTLHRNLIRMFLWKAMSWMIT